MTVVAESGIFTAADVHKIHAANIQAMLVGESLMRQADIKQAVISLLQLPYGEGTSDNTSGTDS